MNRQRNSSCLFLYSRYIFNKNAFFGRIINSFLKITLYLQKVQRDKWVLRCKMKDHFVFCVVFINQKP